MAVLALILSFGGSVAVLGLRTKSFHTGFYRGRIRGSTWKHM